MFEGTSSTAASAMGFLGKRAIRRIDSRRAVLRNYPTIFANMNAAVAAQRTDRYGLPGTTDRLFHGEPTFDVTKDQTRLKYSAMAIPRALVDVAAYMADTPRPSPGAGMGFTSSVPMCISVPGGSMSIQLVDRFKRRQVRGFGLHRGVKERAFWVGITAIHMLWTGPRPPLGPLMRLHSIRKLYVLGGSPLPGKPETSSKEPNTLHDAHDRVVVHGVAALTTEVDSSAGCRGTKPALPDNVSQVRMESVTASTRLGDL